MKNMTAKKIAEATGGRLILPEGMSPAAENTVSCVVTDSRKVSPGCLFLAMRGERVDSHEFIPECVAKGAALIVADREVKCDAPLILTGDSLKALEAMAGFYRRQLNLKVVGITGSVGKTSTKEAIAAVLSEKYKVLKTEGNLNNNIGLPMMVLSIREEHTAAVLEMGISHFGEMERMARAALPELAVMTNIGESHIENLGSREGILKEKSHIMDYLPSSGRVIVNADDDLLSLLKAENKYGYGIRNPKAQVRMHDIVSEGLTGSRFDMELLGERLTGVHTPVPGEHSVMNAGCAALVGKLLGLSNDEIAEGIEKINTLSGRTNVIKAGGFTLIDDCYNAAPSSMKAALKLLSETEGRKVAILGDMFELGEEEESLHEQVGEYAAKAGTDLIVCIGKLSKHMYEGVLKTDEYRSGRTKAMYYETPGEFLSSGEEIPAPGDICLIKASHGMNFSEIVKAKARE